MGKRLPLPDLLGGASGGHDAFHLCCDNGPLIGTMKGDELFDDLVFLYASRVTSMVHSFRCAIMIYK